jgi:lipoyl(octanoyl) transferase
VNPHAPFLWLGRVGYDEALAAMEARRNAILAGDQSQRAVLLLEHEPVITLGRHADRRNLMRSEAELADAGIALRQIQRGGDITYHGPGQLVIYPVLRIGIRVSRFLENIAQALAETTRSYGVEGAEWRRSPAGLWHGSSKLAACGIHVKRGVCCHGFAYNVSTPGSAWQGMIPCGLRDHSMTSLAELMHRSRAVPEVAEFAERLREPLRVSLSSFLSA